MCAKCYATFSRISPDFSKLCGECSFSGVFSHMYSKWRPNIDRDVFKMFFCYFSIEAYLSFSIHKKIRRIFPAPSRSIRKWTKNDLKRGVKNACFSSPKRKKNLTKKKGLIFNQFWNRSSLKKPSAASAARRSLSRRHFLPQTRVFFPFDRIRPDTTGLDRIRPD